MKTIEISPADKHQQDSPLNTHSEKPAVRRSDLMFGRMKGTFIVTGDIVNRDPELWDCERD